MLVQRISMLTGKRHTKELDVTPEQIHEYYHGQKLIQEVFPNLDADDREFIKSGITPKEWEALYKD